MLIFWIKALEIPSQGVKDIFLSLFYMISFEIDSSSLRKPILKQIPLVLTFQAFVYFTKVNGKKHVIVKNFDNKKTTKTP